VAFTSNNHYCAVSLHCVMRTTGILYKDLRTFMIISRSVVHRLRNVSEESCTKNEGTLCVRQDSSENRAVNEIIGNMW
jgi:hypothetical protein